MPIKCSRSTCPDAAPKLQCQSALGSSRPWLRTPASGGHSSQSSPGRDSGCCLVQSNFAKSRLTLRRILRSPELVRDLASAHPMDAALRRILDEHLALRALVVVQCCATVMPVRAGSSAGHDQEAPAAHAGSDHPQARRGQQTLAAGKELDEVCRHLEIAESTWHRWLAQYGGMKANDAKRLKELEAENARLKKLLAEAELDKSCSRSSRRETSDPEPQAQRRRCCANGSGLRTASLQAGWPAPFHATTEPPPVSDDEAELRVWLRAFSTERPGGGGAAPLKPPAGGLAGECQADPPSVA